jgi:hypothetical protein
MLTANSMTPLKKLRILQAGNRALPIGTQQVIILHGLDSKIEKKTGMQF